MVAVALGTLGLAYLGEQTSVLVAPLGEPEASETAGAAPPASEAPSTTASPSTLIPTTMIPNPMLPTTTSLAVAPPSLTDEFQDEFSSDQGNEEPARTTTSTVPPETAVSEAQQNLKVPQTTVASPSSRPARLDLTPKEAGVFAAGLAEAFEGIKKDGPVLASGTVVSLDSELPDDAFDELKVNIQFEYKSHLIVEQHFAALDRIVDLLSRELDLTLLVVGHTDSRGESQKNQALSRARAESVVAYLMYFGIDDARLTAIGRGETEPVASNDTEAGRSENRRIRLLLDQ